MQYLLQDILSGPESRNNVLNDSPDGLSALDQLLDLSLKETPASQGYFLRKIFGNMSQEGKSPEIIQLRNTAYKVISYLIRDNTLVFDLDAVCTAYIDAIVTKSPENFRSPDSLVMLLKIGKDLAPFFAHHTGLFKRIVNFWQDIGKRFSDSEISNFIANEAELILSQGSEKKRRVHIIHPEQSLRKRTDPKRVEFYLKIFELKKSLKTSEIMLRYGISIKQIRDAEIYFTSHPELLGKNNKNNPRSRSKPEKNP